MEQALIELDESFKWSNPLLGEACAILEEKVLPAYLLRCRWFGGKARAMGRIRIFDQATIEPNADVVLLFLRIEYSEGQPEVYLLPVKRTTQNEDPRASIARGGEFYLIDANWSESYRRELAKLISGRSEWSSATGKIAAEHGRSFQDEREIETLPSRVLGVEQSNTSVIFGDRYFCKLYRKIEEGENPDLEITRHLTEERSFRHVPTYVAALKHRRQGHESQDLGLVQRLIANEGDAWAWTLRSLGEFYRRTASGEAASIDADYTEKIALLGRRTAELHRALASPEDPRFAPEPLTPADQHLLRQSMQESAQSSLALLRLRLDILPEPVRTEAQQLLDQEEALLRLQSRVSGQPIAAVNIRVHGDYHLGQVLYTGEDFVMLDFEGEPARSLSERKIKRSPLKDVAGMLRSFHYAAHSALLQIDELTAEEKQQLQTCAELWTDSVEKEFLQAYLATIGGLIPAKTADLETLLQAFLLEKALYEVAYELNNRPSWLFIPIQGIARILGAV